MLVQPQQAATVCELDLVRHTIGSSKRAQTLDPNQPPENSHEALNLRVGAKMPLPGLSGAAAERYGATPSSAGGPMPYRFNEPRRHKIPRARYRVQNWPEYDRALQRRGDLTVWVTPEAIA